MIDSLIKFILLLFSFFFPLFFLSITPEAYEYNKMMLLFGTTLILVFLSVIKLAATHKISLSRNSFTFPFFFFTLLMTLSTFIQSSSRMTTLITPLSTTTFLAGFILYLVFLRIDKVKHEIMIALGINSLILSLYLILTQTKVIPQNSFTPAGNMLATAVYLCIICVYFLAQIITRLTYWRKKPSINKEILVNQNSAYTQKSENSWLGFYLFTFFLSLAGVIILTYQITKVQKPIILPFYFGWGVFLEVLKDTKTLFLGVGPTNFIAAFTLAKPIGINLTPYWNITFTTSSSLVLNLATECGILALLSFLLILFQSIRLLKPAKEFALHFPFTITLLSSLLFLFILPSSMTALILFFILLSFAPAKKKLFEIDLSAIPIISYLLILPIIAAVFILYFFMGKAYIAEVNFKKSLDASLNSNGTQAFNFLTRAISLNPYLDRYHTALSQTDLALVKALSSKSDLGQSDKENIPHLIQQSIEEAKIAVNLNRANVVNWDNLARVYISLINFAQGSDDWSIQTYQQKINLDPFTPGNYVALGGIYLSKEKWTDAETQFRYALKLKPDFANAHYNLAITLREQKRYNEALDEINITKSYTTGEENLAKLEDLRKEIGKNIPKK